MAKHANLFSTPAGRRRAGWLFLREWLLLELCGHLGLIILRQICGTYWTWRDGGPFAFIDVSRAMLLGDAFWVVAVVCTTMIRYGLLAEWERWLGQSRTFGPHAWLPWLIPGCVLGWIVLVVGDPGAAYILGLPAGIVFEVYHALFFGYVAARLLACAIQLAAGARLVLHRCRRAWHFDGPWPYVPFGISVVVGVAVVCALIYVEIFTRGGSLQTEWGLFARN